MYFDDKKIESSSTKDSSNSDVVSILYVSYILIA